MSSVFLNSKDNLNDDGDKPVKKNSISDSWNEKKNELLDYYEFYFPGVIPNPLYKNTKFLTIDKLNGGLLTPDERKMINDNPTGYNFNLKDSGYFVLDVDVNSLFNAHSEINEDWKKIAKYTNPNLKDIPKSLILVEYNPNGKRKRIETINRANVLFSLLFLTPYVLTPSKSFHFYFKNDLTDDQLVDIFGHSDSRYIKSIPLFDDEVSIDVFVDNKKNDSYLVLPFTNLLVENELYREDQENNYKVINVQYSALRYVEYDGKLMDNFRKASDLLQWLLKAVNKTSKTIHLDQSEKYADRGRVINVNSINVQTYLNKMEENFKLLSKHCQAVSTYASKPFNLYQLMAFVAFFPIDMHFKLLVSFIDHMKSKLSENAKEQLLTYYYHLAHDDDKVHDLKHPRYFESVMNNTYGLNIENRYMFEYERDKEKNVNNDEEIIEDDEQDINIQLKYIMSKLEKKYSFLKAPTI